MPRASSTPNTPTQSPVRIEGHNCTSAPSSPKMVQRPNVTISELSLDVDTIAALDAAIAPVSSPVMASQSSTAQDDHVETPEEAESPTKRGSKRAHDALEEKDDRMDTDGKKRRIESTNPCLQRLDKAFARERRSRPRAPRLNGPALTGPMPQKVGVLRRRQGSHDADVDGYGQANCHLPRHLRPQVLDESKVGRSSDSIKVDGDLVTITKPRGDINQTFRDPTTGSIVWVKNVLADNDSTIYPHITIERDETRCVIKVQKATEDQKQALAKVNKAKARQVAAQKRALERKAEKDALNIAAYGTTNPKGSRRSRKADSSAPSKKTTPAADKKSASAGISKGSTPGRSTRGIAIKVTKPARN